MRRERPAEQREAPLRFPALLGQAGGCGTRLCGPHTVLAEFPAWPALLGGAEGLPLYRDDPRNASRNVGNENL